jgi:hypothetical protein
MKLPTADTRQPYPSGFSNLAPPPIFLGLTFDGWLLWDFVVRGGLAHNVLLVRSCVPVLRGRRGVQPERLYPPG